MLLFIIYVYMCVYMYSCFNINVKKLIGFSYMLGKNNSISIDKNVSKFSDEICMYISKFVCGGKS